MHSDTELIQQILALASSATPSNVGDIYVDAVNIYLQIAATENQKLAEYHISHIRMLARDAEIGWTLFNAPPTSGPVLSNHEQIQIIIIISTLHSFCYGVERLDEASFVTGPDSTPVRFYINSLYHYIATLYLLEKNNDPMGGMVYKTLAPMNLVTLLDPIRGVLDKPLEKEISFGETVRKIRNNFLVHGTFSPTDISTIVQKANLQDMTQRLLLTKLIWELFNQSFILKLKLISLLTASKVDPIKLATEYIANTSSL